jgi:amino acid transporter
MQSLGEMATYIPISGAFTAYATRFVDPSLGFAMGWIYWFSWAMTYSLELTATGLIIQYWNQNLSIGSFIGVFWVTITALNFLPVSFYGEFEFWLSTIKVLTVIGFMIFAIFINAGAGQKGYLGFYTWGTPGAFASYLLQSKGALAKFIGFGSVLIQAGFSYQGTELVGIAAGETENPRKNVPAAIRKTYWRILFFFIGTIFFIGLLVPYDDKDLLSTASDATASPFVISAKLVGVPVLPSLINAVLLVVVLSAANSNVYSGSRILFGLANDGSAPASMKRTTAKGVPYVAVASTSAFGLLAFMNLSANGGILAAEHHRHRRLHNLGLHQRLPHRIHARPRRSQHHARHTSIQSCLAAVFRLVWVVLQCVDYYHQWVHGIHSLEHSELLHCVHQCYLVYSYVYWT